MKAPTGALLAVRRSWDVAACAQHNPRACALTASWPGDVWDGC